MSEIKSKNESNQGTVLKLDGYVIDGIEEIAKVLDGIFDEKKRKGRN